MGFVEELQDGICMEIADEAVDSAIGVLEPVNAGQESLCVDLSEQIGSSWESVFQGEGVEISTNHPEAVGEMADMASEILNDAASRCSDIRSIDEVADLLDLF